MEIKRDNYAYDSCRNTLATSCRVLAGKITYNIIFMDFTVRGCDQQRSPLGGRNAIAGISSASKMKPDNIFNFLKAISVVCLITTYGTVPFVKYDYDNGTSPEGHLRHYAGMSQIMGRDVNSATICEKHVSDIATTNDK